MNYVASAMSLKVKTEEGISHELSQKCYQASDSITFVKVLSDMWDEILLDAGLIRIKKISITLYELKEASNLHPDFFEEEQDQKTRKKAEKMSQALDAINHRFGRDSILLGMLPNEGKSFSGTKIAFTRIPDAEEFLE